MESVPTAIAMKMAITQQNVALSMIKKTAQMQQQIVGLLTEGAANISASTRGQTVNISA